MAGRDCRNLADEAGQARLVATDINCHIPILIVTFR